MKKTIAETIQAANDGDVIEIGDLRSSGLKSFEIGKIYIHNSGTKLTIVGAMQSIAFGLCLIGETEEGEFKPIGQDTDSFINWQQIGA